MTFLKTDENDMAIRVQIAGDQNSTVLLTFKKSKLISLLYVGEGETPIKR